jgi:membrane-associated phospholipid phosphatase
MLPGPIAAIVLATVLCSDNALGQTTTAPAQNPSSTSPASQGGDERTSVRFILGSVVRDVGKLPSRHTAVVLGIGGLLTLAVHPSDRRLSNSASRSAPLDRALEIGDPIGNGWTQTGGALGTYVAGALLGSKRTQVIGADLIRADILNGILTTSIKVAADRRRPDGGRYSFPSGHASMTFATATVLQHHLGARVGAPAYSVAVYVAASRLQERRHYASDLIFGAAIGIVSGRTVTIGRGTRRFAASPVAARGVVALQFVLVHH